MGKPVNNSRNRLKNTLKNSVLYRPLRYITGKFIYNLPLSLRYGKAYLDTQNFLERSEFWSADEIREYQLVQLKRIISHAYERVPYYRRLFDNNKLMPADIRDFSDLAKIPSLTKDLIRQYSHELIDRTFPVKHITSVTTSGSTGIPTHLYFDKRIAFPTEWAFMVHQWKRAGFRNKARCIVLRGNIEKDFRDNKSFWQMDWRNNYLIMSSYHLFEDNLQLYINRIRRFNPLFIQAYPSALQVIASHMHKNRIRPFESVRAVFCGSETLYDWQRSLFEEVFQTRVFSFYGHGERLCLAGECEYSNLFHVFPQYGCMELLNKDDQSCTKEGEAGEIVATGFLNPVMPLIRFRTQDIAINTNSRCRCGRNWKMLKSIEGRLQDYFITYNGEIIPFTGVYSGLISKRIDNIVKAQFHQQERGKVIIRAVKGTNYSEPDTKRIIESLNSRYDKRLEFELQFTDDIPRSKSGKYIYLIQNLPVEMQKI